MFIVMSGAVGIYLDDEMLVCQNKITETFTFGEKCFISSERTIREAFAKSLNNSTFCLALSKTDFLDKTFYFEHIKKV